MDDLSPGRVVGYFTLTVAGVDRDLLPVRERRGMPQGGLPVIKLARLAVDRDFQGMGMGGVMIVEASRRAIAAQVMTGSVAVLVEARSERAAGFYEEYGFLRLPDASRVLCMGFGPIRELLQTP